MFQPKAEHHHETVQAHRLLLRHLRASLTVECALVLPLFFLFCVTLISFMTAVKLQVNENLRLSNRARQAAAAAALSGESSESWITLQEAKPFAFSAAFPGTAPLRIACYARVHVWDGSPLTPASSAADRDDTVVFVTNHESVYHTHSDCSHIDLTIYSSTTAQIGSLRNADGRRYRKCRGFPRNYTGTVYASKTGEYYYPSLNYAGLTRHVRCITKEEAGNKRECSRCRARDAADAVQDAA